MDAKSYNAALADLRAVRDQIKKTRSALAKQEADRDKRITQLAFYEKATAERIAPAAGLTSIPGRRVRRVSRAVDVVRCR